ncbi:MAG: iron ABC transporter permease [Oscillospiraceae bacterium]|nr:iron ABC transporter permease [Oscillospiraceae bacterium]
MSVQKAAALTIASAAAVFAVIAVGICVGSVFVPPSHIFAVIENKIFGTALPDYVPQSDVSIIFSVRMPRVFLAFLVGAALAASGAAVQSVLNNPLASPFTLGTSSGASLGASLVIVFEISLFGSFTVAFAGLIFAVAAMFFMVAFAKRLDRSLQSSTVVLTGMVLSLFISAVVTLIASAADEKYKQLMRWQNGSFAGRGWNYDGMMLVMLAVCMVILMLNSRELDILTFGDEQAQSVGLNTGRKKTILLVVSAVLSGTAVSFAGVIGFVDLIAPHIARKIFGAKHKVLIPMSAVTGGIFMVLCDLAARTVIVPNELPVGVVTSLIGAPFFAFVFFKRRTEGK